ncbi:hypothetical protein MNBD_GAMMA03-1335 [hydrothermal vent metagenome]|uniref:Histidine kinase/HSP90-like ATPase domain-containing protein n=1 Tax=hydrothermal vent metagenome TaxID=652676 RepID=A0A3B0W8P6_9ZZZZ
MSASEPLFVIHWLWLGLVLLGVMLFFTAYYFRRQSKRLSQALADLYTLNQIVKQDALDFFDQAWPILESVGCLKLEANIEWFGEKKHIVFGDQTGVLGKKQVFKIARDDMSFKLEIMLNRKATEPESLSFLVIKTFIYVLEQNLVLKQAEILTSQKRLERYQLFVQHEIKNIAQFIQLLCDQLNMIQGDADKIRLINTLHQTLPTMSERAQKTILHMKKPLLQEYEYSECNLALVVQEVVDMNYLSAEITGESDVYLPKALLIEVFKNILGNFRDHALTERLIHINIYSKVEKIYVSIRCQRDKQQNDLIPERLFEPFWTTSESGLGLGLFLARELLKQMNGQVTFEQESDSFSFLVLLPDRQSSK